MGVVFRARDHATGAVVAVKVLRDPTLCYQARLEREAQGRVERLAQSQLPEGLCT